MWQRAHLTDAGLLGSIFVFPDHFWVALGFLEFKDVDGPVVAIACRDAMTGQALVVRPETLVLEDAYDEAIFPWEFVKLLRWPLVAAS